MITRNFPASRSTTNSGVRSEESSRYPYQQEAILSEEGVNKKKGDGKKTTTTMLKIGIITALALAGILLVTSHLAKTKQKSYGHTR